VHRINYHLCIMKKYLATLFIYFAIKNSFDYALASIMKPLGV
jgi:hypothetical protein